MTRWLDTREARAWRGYQRMQTQLSARLDRHLVHDAGMSSADYAVLVGLSEAPEGRLRAFELGAELQWEKSRLSHQLRRMEQRGLVRREDCPSDARGLVVVLTAEGRRAIEETAPQHVDDVRRYFIDVLSPDQLEAMATIADAVLTRLDVEDEGGTTGCG